MIKIKSYDYSGLIESYLAQDRPSASTADNRMSYNGRLLYSYASHLATISINVPNTLYIYKETANYSNTSRNHAHKLRREALLSWSIFTVSDDVYLKDNLPMYWNDIELLITRYKRARILKPSIKQSIHEAVRNAQHFAEVHELDSTVPDTLMRHLFVNQLLN